MDAPQPINAIWRQPGLLFSVFDESTNSSPRFIIFVQQPAVRLVGSGPQLRRAR